jgi:hypothetical protein
LVSALLLKQEQKQSDIWGAFVNPGGFIPMAWIMLEDEYPPMVEYYRNNIELYQQSIESGYIFYPEQVDLIISFAKKFIDKI